MGDLAAYSGLFVAALAAATILRLRSEAVLVGLLLSGNYPTALLIAVASAGNILGAAANWMFLILVTIAKVSRYLVLTAITLSWM